MSWRALPPAVLAVAVSAAAAAEIAPDKVAGLPRAMGFEMGNWRTAITILSVETPADGAPPGGAGGRAAALKAQIGQTEVDNDCLWARADTPTYVLFPGLRLKDECRFEEAFAQQGRWRLKGHCKTADGMESDLAVEGRYTPTSMDSDAALDAALPSGERVRLRVAIAAKHTGECRGPQTIYRPR